MVQKTILIATCDDAARARLEVLLREAGYRVISAWDSRVALERCSEEPDLVVLDELTDKNNFDLCRRLKALREYPSFQVVLVTDLIGLQEHTRALEAGVDAFLAKPFEGDELVSLCQSLIARSRPLTEARASTA